MYRGFIWATLHQILIAPKGIPDLAVLPQVEIQGTIDSIPIQEPNKTQFIFALNRLGNKPAKGLIQLAWYNKVPTLHAGQIWHLTVKLKKPRNFYNSGGYDYESFLATNHINRTGYVLSKKNTLLKNPHFTWLTLREKLSLALRHQAPDSETAGIIEALTLNLTHLISQNQWDLFRRTGTTHLFGISGEHITLVAGLVFWLVYKLWGRIPSLCLYFPALYVASLSGFTVACLYSFLAGFAPPTQRALAACFFYTLCCLGKQHFTAWQGWRYALLIVLCIEPHAVYMQGLFFSLKFFLIEKNRKNTPSHCQLG